MPVGLVSLGGLASLEAQGKVRTGDAGVAQLRESLAADLSAFWEKYGRQKSRRQAELGLSTSDELPLR